MVTAITSGVKISVDTIFRDEHSSPENEHYMFAYRIFIENLSNFSVQLMRRHWFIFDSNGTMREVEGEGVIGEQPIIKPGQTFSYVSGCNLKTDVGSMRGKYSMHNLTDETSFEVEIPEFELIVPYKLN
jgi:ApaG protein